MIGIKSLVVVALVGLMGVMAEDIDCNNSHQLDTYLKDNKAYEALRVITSKEMLDNQCSTLRTSVVYIEAYANKCFKEDVKQNFLKSVVGLREFLSGICDKPAVSKELLTHHDCFKKISSDLTACNKTFHAEAVNSAAMCKARTGYVKCAKKAGENGCNKEGAKAICTLSNIMISLMVPKERCPDQDSLCSSGTDLQATTALLLAGIVLMFKNLY